MVGRSSDSVMVGLTSDSVMVGRGRRQRHGRTKGAGSADVVMVLRCSHGRGEGACVRDRRFLSCVRRRAEAIPAGARFHVGVRPRQLSVSTEKELSTGPE